MRNEKGQFIKGHKQVGGFSKGHNIRNTGKTQFSKGHTTWNKGKKGLQIGWNKGIKTGIVSSSQFKKGHKMSQKIRDKISETLSGENSYLWKGGISEQTYPKEFNNYLREQIRQRDNYICQECSKHQNELRTKTGRKYKLHIHHIDYNKQNCNKDNLISLCRECHQKTNFKRDDWTKYFNQKLWQH